jgi:hypothetical protein
MTDQKQLGEQLKDAFTQLIQCIDRLTVAIDKLAENQAIPAPCRVTDDGKITSFRASASIAPALLAENAAPRAAHTISYDQISAAILQYSDSYGHEAGKALLKRFGASYIKQLKVEDYPTVLHAIEKGP